MHGTHHNHHTDKNIRFAFFLNLSFSLLEFWGGMITNSTAITADALHDLGDSISLGLAWALEKVAKRKPSTTFSYGYKRFSLLSAFINAIILISGSILVLSHAIPRILKPEPTHVPGMILFSLIGILVNGYAAFRVSKGHTMNERMVSWHLFEDVLGWGSVLIISIIMLFKDIYILDPILSTLITLYILWNVVKNLKKTAMIFLQAIPDLLDADKINTKLKQNPTVIGVHDTHIWSLDGATHILSTHLVVKDSSSVEEIIKAKCDARATLNQIGITHATIETEYASENCTSSKPKLKENPELK